MTPAYAKDEVDEWNPQRGSGLLKLRDVVDIQDNWQAFSHRCTHHFLFQQCWIDAKYLLCTKSNSCLSDIVQILDESYAV